MFKKIKLWPEPASILQSLPKHGECEMSSAQHGFLCGLLREMRPRKVLEVGVAAGGTSCVIMEALERLCSEDGTEAVLHSVDLNQKFYRDKRQPVGYMAENMKGRCSHVRHEVYYGAMLSEYIDRIGGNIDFLILDTAHTLPGEILDFLLAMPYLQDKATVVLHDIMLPLLVDSPKSCATNVLLESVQADKYILLMDKCPGGVENIGAFSIGKETRKNAANVFFALLKRWNYGLTDEQAESYRNYYARYYDDECLHLYDAAMSLNRLADYRDTLKGCYVDKRELERVLQYWTKTRGKIVIYGMGKYGQYFLHYAKAASLKVDAFVITDGEPIREVPGNDLPVYELSELPYAPEECTLIIAVQEWKTRNLIEKELRFRGYYRIL